MENPNTSTAHTKVPHDHCEVCGHYGDDCTGTAPATDWHSKADPYGSGEHWIYDGDDNFVASVAFIRDRKAIDSEKD